MDVTGRRVDLNYFVYRHPYLWGVSVRHALEFLGDLRGKRVLEIGGKDARMSSRLAMSGAHVTMLDLKIPEQAHAEVAQWGVADRVRLIQTRGDFSEVAGEKFDAVFTKSLLWCIDDLPGMLDPITAHLATRRKVAFFENHRGGGFLFWVRKHFIYGGHNPYEQKFRCIRPEQLPLFYERFADVTVRQPRLLVYEIFGHGR